MRNLWFYRWMSRQGLLNYRGKIMVMAFLGTHIPLIALAGYFALQASHDWQTLAWTISIMLGATLVGTSATLFVLHQLLRPVILTSEALRAYRETRTPCDLPTEFTDEAGTLMADAYATIAHLEKVRDALEQLDEGTGLPNRKRFLHSAAAPRKGEEAVALTVVRLGNWSRIAETLDAGHAESAMNEIAARVARAMPQASIGRVGTAEFAFRHACEPTETLQALGAKLVAECGGEITLGTLCVKPELSCGVALFPGDAETAEGALDHAIAAAAQGEADLPVVFHSRQAREEAFERLKLEQELRRALDRGEFRLHYQPVVDLGIGGVAGAEALIRWQHPEHGLVMPGRFIPAAEASGLIHPIGNWVLEEAARQAGAWNDAGRKNLRVAVNLSARQFGQAGLAERIAQAVDKASISPDQFEVELTESAAMADAEHTRAVFHRLRDLGVKIAIDDFGTGYAGMSWLRKLPFDKLKIDREFVADVPTSRDAQAICSALVTLCKGLDLRVLAEGAETEEEVRFLSAIGCELFQGYFFAKPMTPAEFETSVDGVTLHAFLRRMENESAADRRRRALAG